ncbi:MAG: TlpA disulfide reductase family protein [Saprospiraceae bacterium]
MRLIFIFLSVFILPWSLSGQKESKIIKVKLSERLDNKSTGPSRFYKEEEIPILKGIPNDLDTFMVFFCPMGYYQFLYEYYKKGKFSKEYFDVHVKNKDIITDDSIAYKTYAFSGLKGDRKIFRIDTNNDGSFLDEKEFNISAYPDLDEIFSKDNWSEFMIFHFEESYKNSVLRKQLIGKIDPYAKLAEPFDKLEETLTINFHNFEYLQGTFTVNEKDYVISTDSRPFYFSIKSGQKDVIQKDFPRIRFGQSISIENYTFYFEDFDYATKELTLIRLDEKDLVKKSSGLEGMQAPEIEGTLIDGEKFSLSSKQGNYVMLEFWGTWCGPCKGDHPKLKKLNETLANKKVELIGIALDYNLENLVSYIQKEELSWPNVFFEIKSPEFQKVTDDYYISKYPTYFLIDPLGKIISRGDLNLIKEALLEL